MAEGWFLKDASLTGDLPTVFRDFSHPVLETALEYGNAGLWSDGVQLLEQSMGSAPDKGERHPLEYYCLGYFSEKLGDAKKAAGTVGSRQARPRITSFRSKPR